MLYTFLAVLAFVTLTAIIARVIRYRGYTVHKVSIYQCAAARGEDYVEITVGGCRLRKPLEVEVKLHKFHSDKALRQSIWSSVKKYDKRVSAVCYKGQTYSF